MIGNLVGILNAYVGISMPYPEQKDVGNDKNGIWEPEEISPSTGRTLEISRAAKRRRLE